MFGLKVLIFNLKVWSSGLRVQFGCSFSFPGTIKYFLLVEREGLDLKVRSFGVEGTIVCLFSSPEIFRCFLLIEKEVLNLEC